MYEGLSMCYFETWHVALCMSCAPAWVLQKKMRYAHLKDNGLPAATVGIRLYCEQ